MDFDSDTATCVISMKTTMTTAAAQTAGVTLDPTNLNGPADGLKPLQLLFVWLA